MNKWVKIKPKSIQVQLFAKVVPKFAGIAQTVEDNLAAGVGDLLAALRTKRESQAAAKLAREAQNQPQKRQRFVKKCQMLWNSQLAQSW